MKDLYDIEHFPEYDNIEFIASQVVEGFITGLHKSPFHGFSVEFAEHRLYNKGESTKHIDWKLFARTEKLFVKRFEEETNLRGQIIIDTSSSMLFPYNSPTRNKLRFAVYAAAALMYMLIRQRDAVGLTTFDNEITFHAPAKSSTINIQLIYNKLRELLNPQNVGLLKRTNTAEILHYTADIIHKKSLVIIFSDFFNDEGNDLIFNALQHLKYNNHEVLIFHVVDKSLEMSFNFPNRPYKFVDLETGSELKLNAGEVREEYMRRTAALVDELKVRCGQYDIDLIEADINEGFDNVLKPYLLRRMKYY